MRILALAGWWPEPMDNGIRLRIGHLLSGLSRRHTVDLVAMHGAEAPRSEHLDVVRQMCASAISVPAYERALAGADRLVSLWRNEPASVRATWNQPFADLVRRRTAETRPDVVLAFELSTAPYARLIPDVPRVLDDLEMARIFDSFASERHPRRRLRAWLTWSKHREYVVQTLRDFAGYTTVSAREARLAFTLAPRGMPAIVAPNGAVVDGQPGRFGPPHPDRLIYPGALSFDANFDAMDYFLRDIFPLIRAERPNARLQITGKAHSQRQAALPADVHVEFTGFVEDVRPLVARAWAEVVPLRQGSGTRLKILEALALGTPVISTSKGAEGLDIRDGEHLLIADTPAAFARAALSVLADPGLRERLAQAGYQAVRDQYDWHMIATQLEALLEMVARPVPRKVAS